MLQDVALVVPYDEFMCLEHVFVEAGSGRARHQVDMFFYFEQLIDEITEGLKVWRAGAGSGRTGTGAWKCRPC